MKAVTTGSMTNIMFLERNHGLRDLGMRTKKNFDLPWVLFRGRDGERQKDSPDPKS